MKEKFESFPEIDASEWLHSAPLKIQDLRGKVILLYAFQMLCPGCVVNSGPQVAKIHQIFQGGDVQVIGLHTVFEHHEAMKLESLKAYLYEFKYDYPVAIDRHVEGNRIPVTMDRLALQGTPSIILIDKIGRIRRQFFGGLNDLVLGIELGLLLSETIESLQSTDIKLH